MLFKPASIDAGDIESMPFIEALGQFSYRVGKLKMFFISTLLVHSNNFFFSLLSISYLTAVAFIGPGNFCLIHVSLVPVLNVVGEQVCVHEFVLLLCDLV